MSAELVTARHLGRKAVIYVRQSSPHQVLTNQESLRLQYALRQRARELGWQEAEHRGDRHRPRLERGGRRAPPRLQGPDRPRHPGRGRHHPVLRGHPARAELLGLVPAARPVRLPGVSDRRSRWRVRPGIAQRAASAGAQGHHVRGRAAHAARPPDRRPAEQGRPRRAGAGAAGGSRARCRWPVTKDPDREVQDRLALVFATFLEQARSPR